MATHSHNPAVASFTTQDGSVNLTQQQPSIHFWFPHSNPQLGSDTKLEKPRRKPAEHKGSLKHTGGETFNSIVFKNKYYIYRKLIS